MSRFFFPPSLHRFVPLYRAPLSGDQPGPAQMQTQALLYDLVFAMRPALVVQPDIGTSVAPYFALCQAFADAGLDGLCYGFGRFDAGETADPDRNHEALNRFNREHFAAFSYLLPNTADGARAHFDAGSINILLMDADCALNTGGDYLERWISALHQDGILILMGNYSSLPGWQALAADMEPVAVNGQLAVVTRRGSISGGTGSVLPELIFQGSDEDRSALRALYHHAGEYLALKQQDKAHN